MFRKPFELTVSVTNKCKSRIRQYNVGFSLYLYVIIIVIIINWKGYYHPQSANNKKSSRKSTTISHFSVLNSNNQLISNFLNFFFLLLFAVFVYLAPISFPKNFFACSLHSISAIDKKFRWTHKNFNRFLLFATAKKRDQKKIMFRRSGNDKLSKWTHFVSFMFIHNHVSNTY